MLKNILVVDDEVELLELLQKKLIETGYKVNTAQNGEGAVLKAKATRPDLIIMDIILPDMDGAEAVSQLQLSPETETIPVLFLSGIVDIPNKEKNERSEIKIGNQKYAALGKPFSPELLISEIGKILDQRETV